MKSDYKFEEIANDGNGDERKVQFLHHKLEGRRWKEPSPTQISPDARFSAEEKNRAHPSGASRRSTAKSIIARL